MCLCSPLVLVPCQTEKKPPPKRNDPSSHCSRFPQLPRLSSHLKQCVGGSEAREQQRKTEVFKQYVESYIVGEGLMVSKCRLYCLNAILLSSSAIQFGNCVLEEKYITKTSSITLTGIVMLVSNSILKEQTWWAI